MYKTFMSVVALAMSCSTVLAAGSPWMEKAVGELRKEKKIVEVMFPNGLSTSLWISVRDDGSRRDGYAEYACLILIQSEMPMKKFTVIHIWDAAAMSRGEQKELGRYECQNNG